MNDLTNAMQVKILELEERVRQLEEINATVLTEVLQYLKENQSNSIRAPKAPGFNSNDNGSNNTFH